MTFIVIVILIITFFMFNTANGNGVIGCLAAFGVLLFALFVIAVCLLKYGLLMG